jgi:formate hydrogenlyase transcriptional activator
MDQTDSRFKKEDTEFANHRLNGECGAIVGRSKAIRRIKAEINQVASTNVTVLVMGETGTGKELIARAIHDLGPRKNRRLVKVNCGALSPTLIETELFGHEKGAFTGAVSRRVGRFELANGGTLFLDEIGEFPLDLQAKLLRVLEEGEFERVGSSKTIRVDIRIIAATNRNLRAEIQQGNFREDLWYRLSIFPITSPPLRERVVDIPMLLEFFLGRICAKFETEKKVILPETMSKLCNYSWPGNVRELANVVERLVIQSSGSFLEIDGELDLMEGDDLKRDSQSNAFKPPAKLGKSYTGCSQTSLIEN